MKKMLVPVLFAVLVLCVSCVSERPASSIQDNLYSVSVDKAGLSDSKNLRQWFADAGLGLFLHWGISSAHPEGGLEISWSMIKDWHPVCVTPAEYFKLAEVFSPEKYDPDKWCRAAARAGFRYAVLTTRHHDGYALWPSEYGHFSTKQYMNGRDLVRPFVKACRKYGLRVGLYYSPPDWYYNRDYMSFRLGTEGFDLWAKTNPEGQPLGIHHEPIKLKPMPDEWKEDFKDYMKGQVTELLTDYGPIDLLWFDYNFGGVIGITMEEIREISPQTVVSHRLHGEGDFLTYEGALPKEKPPIYPWEMCTVIGQGWAYRKNETYQSTGEILEQFVTTRSMGGNFLPNVAPRPDGTLPETVYERFRDMREWMRYSRESVFDIKGAYWLELCNYPLTMSRDESVWYVHFTPDAQEPAVLKTERAPRKIILLRTAKPVPFTMHANEVHIVPGDRLIPNRVETVKITWD